MKELHGMRKIEMLKKELTDNLDILIGSVVMYRSKCGKNCTCNNGEKHICYYLSSKKERKTKNLYLPPGAVEEAREMNERYRKVLGILQEISLCNYENLKKRNLTKGK
jgi:intergrase/recombinase